MPWTFVGRAKEIGRIRVALEGAAPRLMIITGAPGIGRTAVLSRVLEDVEDDQVMVIRIAPSGDFPFAALRPYLPDGVPGDPGPDAAIHTAARALADQAGRRRLVVGLDDAHLVDQASILALRVLSHEHRATLVVTRPNWTESVRLPDPTGCLTSEPGLLAFHLAPLGIAEVTAVVSGAVGGQVCLATAEALMAASGGNPAELYDLVVRGRLAESMMAHDGVWRLGVTAVRRGAPFPTGRIAALVEVAVRAWQELALDRAEELCRLVTWLDAGPRVAAIRANLLLLQCRAAAGLDLLDSLPRGSVAQNSHLALARAMSVAFGLRRPVAACDFLFAAAAVRSTSGDAGLPDRLLAYRAWILAATGRAAEAAEAIEGIGPHADPECRLFVRAARASIALAAGRLAEAVAQFRRALVTAGSCLPVVPWMRHYLTASLIDALLLAGRNLDATTAVSGFHSGRRCPGWEVVVALFVATGAHDHAGPLTAELVVESPLPAVEPPLPAVESPLPAVESPLPAVESPLPAVESPLPAVDSPLPMVS